MFTRWTRNSIYSIYNDPRRLKMETEMILIGTMASFILGMQFYGIKQLNKLCERVTRLETKISNNHA